VGFASAVTTSAWIDQIVEDIREGGRKGRIGCKYIIHRHHHARKQDSQHSPNQPSHGPERRDLVSPRVALGERGLTRSGSYYGATVTSWVAGGKERLFVSDKASLDGSKPIRGGVPICWVSVRGRRPGGATERSETKESSERSEHRVSPERGEKKLSEHSENQARAKREEQPSRARKRFSRSASTHSP
jgi:hypothetical protein